MRLIQEEEKAKEEEEAEPVQKLHCRITVQKFQVQKLQCEREVQYKGNYSAELQYVREGGVVTEYRVAHSFIAILYVDRQGLSRATSTRELNFDSMDLRFPPLTTMKLQYKKYATARSCSRHANQWCCRVHIEPRTPDEKTTIEVGREQPLSLANEAPAPPQQSSRCSRSWT